jgi:hypothetical protein
MTKRMREYVVHWLLLHGKEKISWDRIDPVFMQNYHTQDKPNSGAREDVYEVMHKGGYLQRLSSKKHVYIEYQLTEKALCKAKH